MTPTNTPNLNFIRQKILRYLAKRDHSQQEIISKLERSGFSPSDFMVTIHQFMETGLINDARFTEHYLAARLAKGYGPRRIAQELAQRGITDELIAEQLKITDNVWLIAAHKVWQKHFKNKTPANFHDRAKQMRFLYYRGFTQEHINHLFSSFSAE